ncbi:outer membrane efflux protein [Calothrix parasitica NIES-267]|uniref:Outer membrane efflux protein n=1 Tax=Calothrix parasitica NIES-267 TaxID=1973488 RepID=A0A1Z4LPG2_9CYAN|nr:outer membrane efflux protein [Calothrix parasitica NIES-267]
MKAQQILNSLLPGVTAAVLTAQPTLADTVTVNNSHPGVYPSIFTTSGSGEDVLSNTFKPSTDGVDEKYPAPFTPAGVEFVKQKPVNHHRIDKVEVNGKTGASINAISGPELSLKSDGLNTTSHRSLVQPLKKPASRKVSYRNNNSSGIKKISPVGVKKNPDDKIFQKLQQIATGPGAADLLKVEPCPIQQDKPQRGQDDAKLQNILSSSAASACQKINSIPNNRLAQSISPAPVQPVRPGSSSPAPIAPSLDPSANPLQYPTKPSEVRVEQNQPLTLEQALEFARRNNQELQVALLQLDRAKAGLKVARAALLPNVGLSAEVRRSSSAQSELQRRLQDLPDDTDDPTTAFSGGAQITYDVYTSGLRSARIRQAKEQLRLQELDVERLSEEIRLNVATEYYNLQQADEQVRISKTAVGNAEASLRDARALEEAGVGTRFDSLRTQVNLANSQQQLTNARSQQQIARRQLVTRLNLAQTSTLSAADPVKLAGLWNQTLENSIVLAYQNRPELQQQLAQRNINKQQRREALAQLGPQVAIEASYSLLDQFNDSVGLANGYSVALTASLNLFDGGASKAQATQFKVDTEIAETQFSSTRNQIRFQVEQAYSQLESNLENVQTSEAALNQARESLRLARLRFQAGVGTQLEVLDAENALTQAEGNRINAILDYNRALASLQRAVTSRGLP